jgi:hypothetical protein
LSEKSNARLKQLTTALRIKKNLGLRSAAGYMRNRKWSVEMAAWWLARKENSLQGVTR